MRIGSEKNRSSKVWINQAIYKTIFQENCWVEWMY